jgi:hypothetical protein
MPFISLLVLLMHLIMSEVVVCRSKTEDRTGLRTRQVCRWWIGQVNGQEWTMTWSDGGPWIWHLQEMRIRTILDPEGDCIVG